MAKAKKGGKSAGKSAAPAEMLLVASKVRQMIKYAGCNTSGDALNGLNEAVATLVRDAISRTRENKRVTVRAYDF